MTVALTPAESLLASRIGFDEDVLRLVKGALGKDTIEPYEQFEAFVSGSYILPASTHGADLETDGKGFTVRLADVEDYTWHLDELYKVRALLPPDYMAFSTDDYNYRPGLTVLKTKDPYEIIRVSRTQGWDFEGRNYWIEDIVKVLVEWQQRCGMNLIGAGHASVKLILKTLPNDLVAFAEEVNYLCPELDQIHGFGSYGNSFDENHVIAEKLAAILRKTRRLYLWWD